MTNTSTRKTVCQICNRLVKQGYPRCCAMATAWRLVKYKSLASKVAGTSYDGRQNALAYLAGFAPSTLYGQLRREPGNVYDANAVAVYAVVPGRAAVKVGYLPAAVAAVVAAIIDKGQPISCDSLRIVGGFGEFESYGVRVTVSLAA